MTKAEQQAHIDTLQEARTAAERAVRRVMQELGDVPVATGLLGPLNAINTAFENAVERIRMMRTED